MNIVNKLTVRHLKQNKRRTLVTIIGVIISVAMVTAVSTLGVSFMDLLQRQSISSNGEWHVLYKDVNKSQLKAIDADEDTQTLVVSRDRGYALLQGGDNANKPYLYIKEYNEQGYKQFPIELSSGRLPHADNEVVISEDIATNAKVVYKIGDTLTLDVGERTRVEDRDAPALKQTDRLLTYEGKMAETLEHTEARSYKVVGFIKRPTWEPTWAPGYTVISYVDESILGANDIVNATVVLNKVESSLFAHAKDLAKQNNIRSESIEFNNSLLRYYGVMNNDGLRSTILSLSSIIMGIIIVGSVSLIYNAFAISVSERSRHLGMLSSVGATARQKRNSVFFEGTIIGLISIPIGIICGLVGIAITFWFINSMIQGAFGVTEELTVSITPGSLGVACAVSIITIFISTYLPARKASRISAIDAIRQTSDVKLTSKVVKTSKLVRKLFGVEAEIGLKNLKRNRRRYQATVFSLVISIVLFLSVSYFTDNFRKSLELSQGDVNFDIKVASVGIEPLDDQLINSIANLDDITEFSVMKGFELHSWIDEKVIANELHNLVKEEPSMLKEGKFQYYIEVHVLNDKYLQDYAKRVGADYKQLIDPGNLSAIVVDKISYEDEISHKFVETTAIHTKVGQSIDLDEVDWETGKETPINKIRIAALTDQLPMGAQQASIGGLNIIISEQVMDQLTVNGVNTEDQIGVALYLKTSNPMATQQEIEEMKESNIYIYNVYQYRQENDQMLLLMSVFTYGFIVLITLISVANIFNTISTSISLRKREFAMLKSVGMTPKGFNKMINYESIFYGIKSLLYGLPISIGVMYLMYKSLMNSFQFDFTPPWISIMYVIVAVFIIVSSAMLYASSKVKKENIIDALKQESI
ncbi:putative ABC transport system permease protein [Paenibacillus sp. DS2015]|uniref:FtsX-like permease family protein n=1 Tax=Paenibacillus sp. DS2015 TaxID=3373917 RepID=UPI003D212125